MPYCPKCDMEFVEGVTVCTDCGGPLYDSKEEAVRALKEQEALEQAEYAAAQASMTFDDGLEVLEGENAKTAAAYCGSPVYVNKAQKQEDLKSSASAFIIVGGFMLIFSVLCWANIISLPMTGGSRIMFQSVLTIMGVGSLIIAVKSAASAKSMSGEIAQEENKTQNLLTWFTTTYTADDIDKQIYADTSTMAPEELSLKRFDVIADLLVTNQDLPDQGYVDALCEEIYAKMFE